MRNVIYPFLLSIPAFILRYTGLDYNVLVVNSFFMANMVVFVVSDIFLYKLADSILGKRPAKIAMLYCLVNSRMNELFHKTMPHVAEYGLTMIALYYYFKLRPQLDKSMVVMTASITAAFIIRSSTLLAWVPMALIKMA